MSEIIDSSSDLWFKSSKCTLVELCRVKSTESICNARGEGPLLAGTDQIDDRIRPDQSQEQTRPEQEQTRPERDHTKSDHRSGFIGMIL